MRTNWKRLLLAIYRIEESQAAILDRLDKLEKAESPAVREDAWVQKGIDSILSFQAGKKKREGEQ